MPRICVGFPVGRFVLGLVLAFSAPGGSAWAAPEHPIVVGTEIGFPPYVDVDAEGRSTGFAVELFAAVAAVMDIQASYRPDRWDTVWRGLQSGELDALPLAARLPEREGLVEFTRPHTLGYDSFFVRKGRAPIASLAQARALSVIVLRSDASHHALASRGFQRQLVLVDSLADGFRLLASGQHDAVLAPLLQGNMLVKALGVATVVEPGPLLKEYRREFCFAVRKGDMELRDRLDEGLAIVTANGEYDRLYRKWLGIYEPHTFPVRYVAWGGGAALVLLALLGLWTWQLRRQVARRTAELFRASAAVQTERQRLHDVLQKLPVYVVLLSADFRVSFANRFFEERYGMPQGRRCFEHLFSLGVPCEICETYKVLQTNAPVKWAWTGPDGRDYDIYDSPFTDSDGSPMILQVGIDVTETNRAKQALSVVNLSLERRVAERTAELEAAQWEAEQVRDLLQITMDNAPALISYIDAECRYRRVNQCYEQWFGLTQEEIVGHSMREVLGEAAWQSIAPYVVRALAGERVSLELQVPYRQGGTRWVHATYSPDRDAGGLVRGFVVHVLDITERKERELELRRYRDILESARDLVASATPDGRVFYLNSAGRELVGIPPGESNLGVIADYHPPETADTIVRKILPVCAELGHWEGETVFRSRDGRDIPVWQSIVAHRSPAGPVLYYSTIGRDITDRKQAEAAGREAARRKDEFLAMLAHELRNPLAPIGNAAHILKLGGLDEARLDWCREVIDRQVEHMTRLVDDLLDVSRISRGKIELKKAPLAVAEVVQRAVETSRPLLDARRHTLSLHLPEEAVYVEGDLVRLAQVLSNLLNNAAKYTDEGGRVQLTVEASGGDVFIRVRDNGRGIDPSVLSSLFDLFYQADRSIDRSEGGLGIGLSLVRSLVAMHGGDVRVYSEGRGKGSEFVVRLPRLPELPSAAAAKGAELPPAEGKLRILVVDDNRDAAESLAMLLGIEGHAVSLAYDGPTALEVALAECPDAVLLDIGLPGMDGYAVARALRRQAGLETMRLIAVSGYGQAEDREKAKTAGFDGFLTKPVHPPELLAALTLRP